MNLQKNLDFGITYLFSIFIDDAQTCNSRRISWIFVLDSSSRVGVNEYMQEKSFFKNFTDASSFGTNLNTDIGIVNFGTNSQIEANCTDFITKQEIKDKLDSLPKLDGQTGIHRALQNSLNVAKACNQSPHSKVLIVFVTKNAENVDAENETRAIADEIKSAPNIHIAFLLSAMNNNQAATFDHFTVNNKSFIERYSTFDEIYNINTELLRSRMLSLACEGIYFDLDINATRFLRF